MTNHLRLARFLLVLAPLACAACSGIDLHDNPPREVQKQTGPLIQPPPHLNRGDE